MITYREFLQNDIPMVLDMWRSAPGVHLHENGEDSVEGVSLCIRRNEGLSFIAEDNGKIVGAVLNGQDGRRGYIYHLVVAEEYRRQGIAARLIQLTKNAMSNAGIHKLALFVLNENTGAQAFYKETGWNEETVVKIFSQII